MSDPTSNPKLLIHNKIVFSMLKDLYEKLCVWVSETDAYLNWKLVLKGNE